MIRGVTSFDVKIFFIRSDTILTVNCNFAFTLLAMFFLENPEISPLFFRQFGSARRFRRNYPAIPCSGDNPKILGDMTRKLSVTESRSCAQLRGTFSRRNSSVASANWVHVA